MAEQEKETLDQQPPLEEQAAEQTEAEAAAGTPEEAAARQLEQLREENKALEERHLRLMAEFGNFKNRTAKEKDNIYGDAVAGTLRELLPVLDNLQRALDSPCAEED